MTSSAEPAAAGPARVLVIAAHADDADFRCSGTLAKWCRAGTVVSHLILTDGSKGSHDLTLTDADVAGIRRGEQLDAAKHVGYDDVRYLGEVDGLLAGTEDVIARTVRVIRETRPEIVLTYDPWAPYMLHPDHTAAGDIAFRSVIRAREPRFYGPDPWRVAALWLFAPLHPEHVEDITATFDAKLAAILSHRSQYPTEMSFVDGDEAGRAAFVERMHAQFRRIGERGGHGYGEEFKRLHL